MRIAYLDCFSGISGDMFLGALVDAGVSPKLLEDAVRTRHRRPAGDQAHNAERHFRHQGGRLRERRKRSSARSFPGAARARSFSLARSQPRSFSGSCPWISCERIWPWSRAERNSPHYRKRSHNSGAKNTAIKILNPSRSRSRDSQYSHRANSLS